MADKYKSCIKKLKHEMDALRIENQQLKEQIISLKNVINFIPASIYWKDKEGRYLGCNNYLVKMAQLSSVDEIIGKKVTDFFNKEIAEEIEATDNEVLRSGETKTCEEKGYSAHHNAAIFLTQKAPLHDKENNIIGLLGVSVDITERKKMEKDLQAAKEKAEASSHAKTQFLAIINHELCTPLACIVGLLSFLKRGNLSPEDRHDTLQNIDNCTRYLRSLVNDILDFSSLESDNHRLHKSNVNFNTLLIEIYNMLKPLAESKGLSLQVSSLPNPPLNIRTDARLLRQMLINLTMNAIKFTEKGQVSIQIDSTAVEPNKVKLAITIADTGRGIPKNKLDLVFEPFQQLENAYTRQSSRNGTGLGLAIVKKLASLIKAKISVESKVGVGSTFCISANFQTTDRDEAPIPPKPLKNKSQKTHPKPLYPHVLAFQPSILLIEDDPIVQYIHKKMLEELGCNVDVVNCGLEAINRINDDHHLVFVDISLPDISGFDVIKSIRDKDMNRRIPIVALTAYSGNDEKKACLSAGADEFKNKPISPVILKKLLIRHL